MFGCCLFISLPFYYNIKPVGTVVNEIITRLKMNGNALYYYFRWLTNVYVMGRTNFYK